MHIRERNVALEQYSLYGLFGGLLGLKAKVFQIGTGNTVFRQCQIASGTIQPLSRVVRREAFRRLHK